MFNNKIFYESSLTPTDGKIFYKHHQLYSLNSQLFIHRRHCCCHHNHHYRSHQQQTKLGTVVFLIAAVIILFFKIFFRLFKWVQINNLLFAYGYSQLEQIVSELHRKRKCKIVVERSFQLLIIAKCLWCPLIGRQNQMKNPQRHHPYKINLTVGVLKRGELKMSICWCIIVRFFFLF